MANRETYEEFVEKFKPKKTTDDCYTPPLVYDAVADYVAKHYGLDRADFVRPFYPGGDYESYDYTGKVVVDNPPFSILAKILDFYISHSIKFFLFAPTLTIFNTQRDRKCTSILIDVGVTYENGAVVHTSFLTNLGNTDIIVRTSPTLYYAVKKANDQQKQKNTKKLPKYEYPTHILTAARMQKYSSAGIRLEIRRDEVERIACMDEQKPIKKTIYGGGFLVSDSVASELENAERENAEREKAEREKAEREKAEREKAIKLHLSYREKEIIKRLSKERDL